ncbi:MAG: nucleoside hydrolase [Kiloniellales bacterium]
MRSMAPRAIIIDCDPGQDDAVAILLALASPDELDVLGITTVAGNVPLALTAKNARKMCELAGRTDVPVFAGCARPLMRPLRTAEDVHGKTGLDGAGLPDPRIKLEDRHGVDFLVDALKQAPDAGVTLCALGPLTNLAMALVKAPEIAGRIREIVLMGGAFGEGNTTPAAEFNIYVDPQAAHVVFTAGVPITMMGLDVTHQALTTPERLKAIRAIGTPVAAAVAGMLAFYDRHDVARYGMPGGPLHDPCVIAYLLRPELFSGRQAHVAVETGSELTMGRTVVDRWGLTDLPPNAQVMDQIDADGYYALIIERLRRLPLAAQGKSQRRGRRARRTAPSKGREIRG